MIDLEGYEPWIDPHGYTRFYCPESMIGREVRVRPDPPTCTSCWRGCEEVRVVSLRPVGEITDANYWDLGIGVAEPVRKI